MKVRYDMIAPPPALAEVVRYFWVFEIEGIHGDPYVYRSMADGCAELVFHYRGPFSEATHEGLLAPTAATLHAQTAHHRRFEVRENFGIFGAYLFPYAIPRLVGQSAHAVSNEMPDLQAIWGADGNDLTEQIILATSDQARATILSRFLLGRLARARACHPLAPAAIRQMLQSKGQIPITTLADKVAISPRQLERIFKDYAGFGPKTYARILRFQAATAQFGHKDQSLIDIALDCGYFDQAHFNHDFKQFSGYTPSEYFRGRPEGIEYKEA